MELKYGEQYAKERGDGVVAAMDMRQYVSWLESKLDKANERLKNVSLPVANVITVSENLCDTCVKDSASCKYAGSSNTKINTMNFNIVECYQYEAQK